MADKDLIKSGEQTLDVAIEDLLSVDAGDHVNSAKFNTMETALRELLTTMKSLSEPVEGKEPVLDEAGLNQLKQKYAAAINSCNAYTKFKFFDRKSGYGKGRLQCVRTIRSLLERDLAALNPVHQEDERTLSSVIAFGRMDEAVLDVADKDLVTVGENSSVRLPLEITTDAGVEKGFFTEESRAEDLETLFSKLQQEFPKKENPELKKFLGLLYDKDGNPDAGHLNIMNSIFKNLHKSMKDSNLTFEDIKYDEEEFIAQMMPLFSSLFGRSRADKEMLPFLDHPEKKEKLFAYLEAMDGLVSNYGMTVTGKFAVGSSVPNRNVAMSRVADALGLGHIIAKAKKISITDKDGHVRNGVFQETAEGSDIRHMKADDPLFKVGDHPELMNDPEVKRQIADLQVLDYLCGNNDRHEGNVIYKVAEDTNGNVRVLGITGIDNDRSFGKITQDDIRGFGYVTPPDMMKVIRQSTYDALCEITKEKAKLLLADLSISEDEISAFMKRQEDIVNAVKKGEIELLSDEKFAQRNLKDLREKAKYKGKKALKENTFEIVGNISGIIRKTSPEPEEKDLQYNKARLVSEAKFRKADNGSMYPDTLAAHADQLQHLLDIFKETKSWGHSNGSAYKWMEESIRNVIQAVREVQENPPQPGAPIPAETAEKMDRLYRQMRLASSKYLIEHPSPSSPMGVTRREGALSIYRMYPVRLDESRVKVRELDFSGVSAQNNNALKEKKPGLRQTIRNAKHKAIENPEIRLGDH